MKLFLYYALHSFKNQLKKLFKTWILVFIVVCVVFGGVVGIIVGTIADSIDNSESDSSQVEVQPPEESDEDIIFEITFSDASRNAIIELVAGGVILLVLIFMAFSADQNGSKIFLPADVNLLFASPMKPQSVLMFRLTTRLGIALLGSIYMLAQIPNLTLNLGLSIWSALSVIAVWCFTIVLGTLIQVLLYTLSSTYPAVKRFLRVGIYTLLALLAAGYLAALRQGGGYLAAAEAFFNAKASRYIPVWGWLKGFCMFAIEGNAAAAVLCLAGILLSTAVLLYLIWHIKADFYEDAMAKSEETAALLESAKSEQSGGVVRKRKKDRSEKLRRDELRYGNGANVFFFKTLYNRFRFAHLGFLTKTMEFYLVAAVVVGVICRFSAGTTSILPVALTLAGLSFFRSLGNPLEQDTKMDCFVMIPESHWAKLFWSLIGGSMNCLLDLLLPMIVGALLVGANPFAALLWIPFIVSLDFYATGVGTFINLSVPVSAGKTIKQIVQIMFVYFGLVPDIMILVIGGLIGFMGVAAVLASFVNLGIGLLFFAVSPFFLDRR